MIVIHKCGPILIYDSQNRNIRASELSLTNISLDGTANDDLNDFTVVIAKKYNSDNNTFYVTRKENVGVARQFSDLNIAVPKDGVVLLFPNNLLVEIPNVNDGIQFDFDYKKVPNGQSTEGFGIWRKVNLSQVPSVESEVLDCYSVTCVNSLNTNNEIPSNGPVLIYNQNGNEINFNQIPISNNNTGKKLSFHFVIAEKKDDKYKVIEHSTKSNASLDSINTKIPKDGIVLIWNIDTETYGETKFPEVGNVLSLDFDYKNATNGTVYRYGYFEKEKTSGNGLTPIDNKDLSSNESIVDNEELIKINLFDYNDYINENYFEYAVKNGKTYVPLFEVQEFDSNCNDLRYSFQQTLSKDYNATTNVPSVTTSEKSRVNRSLFILGEHSLAKGFLNKKIINGYPMTIGEESLGFLFGEEDKYNAVEAYKNLSGLFIYDKETGEYRFDSREHCAQLNKKNNKFDLYNERLSPGILAKTFGNFMPFNDITKATKSTDIDRAYFEKLAANCYYQASNLENKYVHRQEYGNLGKYFEYLIDKISADLHKEDWNNEEFFDYMKINKLPNVPYNSSIEDLYTVDFDDEKDYHYGLTVEAKFKTYEGNQLDGNDVIYRFEGDDDVFVYIDDVLFLDLGGSHSPVGGEINFTKGTVQYFDNGGEGNVSTWAHTTETFEDIVKNANADIVLNENGTLVEDTIHTLKFYYLERGSGVSLCSIRFNINIVSEYTAVEGKKEWKYADNPDEEPEDKPDSIMINLYRKMEGESGEEIIEGPLNTQEISATNGWKYSFNTDSEGHRLTTESTILTSEGEKLVPCTYYVVEEYLKGDEEYYDKYVTEYVEDPKSTDYDKVVNITNWYNYTNVTVKKEWDDNNNATNQRPQKLKVVLSAKESNESKIADEIVNSKSWNAKLFSNARMQDTPNQATTKNSISFSDGTSFTFKQNDKYMLRYYIIDKIENDTIHYQYDSGWKEDTKNNDFTAVVDSDRQMIFSFKKYDEKVLTQNDINEIKRLIIYTDPNCKDITNDIFNAEQIKQLTQHLTASENENDNWSYTWNELPRCIINEDKSITKINYDIEEELEETEERYYQLDKIKIETTGKFYNITIINSMYRDIQVTKIDDKDESIKIGGAEFKLEKLKLNEKGEWVVDETHETVYRTTSNDTSNLGEGLFERLGPGKYLLSETKAPPGYNKSKEKITIDIVALESDNIVKVDFKNKKGFALPFTGGNTTLSYIIIGVAVMILALDFMRPLLLVNRKNKRKPKRRKKVKN